MRILNITARKPHATGSGVFLTETVEQFQRMSYEDAVVADICREDSVR